LKNVMIEDRHSTELTQEHGKKPEARYAYYRRCQEFRRNGEQCKAPAEKGEQVCHAHAGQRAMALRREWERRAVLAEAVALMRKKGHLRCEMADLFTSFNGIQVTLAVMAQALIDGRIDCKTAGRLAVNLQTMGKLLRMVDRRRKALTTKDTKEHKGLLTVQDKLTQIHGEYQGKPRLAEQISADERRLGEQVYHRGHRETQRTEDLTTQGTWGRTLPLIHTDNTDRTETDKADKIGRNDWRATEDARTGKIVAIRGAAHANVVPYTDTGPSRWWKAA
jgi:hypothetical protein